MNPDENLSKLPTELSATSNNCPPTSGRILLRIPLKHLTSTVPLEQPLPLNPVSSLTNNNLVNMAKEIRPSTFNEYEKQFAAFVGFCNSRNLDQTCLDSLAAWAKSLQNDSHYCTSTIETRLSQVRYILNEKGIHFGKQQMATLFKWTNLNKAQEDPDKARPFSKEQFHWILDNLPEDSWGILSKLMLLVGCSLSSSSVTT